MTLEEMARNFLSWLPRHCGSYGEDEKRATKELVVAFSAIAAEARAAGFRDGVEESIAAMRGAAGGCCLECDACVAVSEEAMRALLPAAAPKEPAVTCVKCSATTENPAHCPDCGNYCCYCAEEWQCPKCGRCCREGAKPDAE